MNHHVTAVRTYPGIIPKRLERVVIQFATNLRGDASKHTLRRIAKAIRFVFRSFGNYHVVRSPGRIAIYDHLGRIAASITQSTFHV